MTATEDPDSDVIGILKQRLHMFEQLWRATDVALFRQRVVERVDYVSPVLADLVRRGEIDLTAAIDGMRPAHDWISGLSHRRLYFSASSRSERLLFPPSRGYSASAWFETRNGERVGVGIREGWLDLVIPLAFGARLLTRGARGALRLDAPLPATLLMAMVGKPIDRVVAHPLLFGSGIVVTGYRVGRHGGSTLRLDVGSVEVDLMRDFPQLRADFDNDLHAVPHERLADLLGQSSSLSPDTDAGRART